MRSKILIFAPIFLALFLLGSLSLVYLSPEAKAHAVLINSSPKNGEVLRSFPQSIELEFNEPLLDIKGSKAGGSLQIDLESKDFGLIANSALISGQKVLIKTQLSNSEEIEGQLLLKYRVVSQDGHIIKGQINFLISSGATSNPLLIDTLPLENNEGLSIFLIIGLIIISFAFGVALLIQPVRERETFREKE